MTLRKPRKPFRSQILHPKNTRVIHGTVTHACNSRTLEAEAGRFQRLPGQPVLQNEILSQNKQTKIKHFMTDLRDETKETWFYFPVSEELSSCQGSNYVESEFAYTPS